MMSRGPQGVRYAEVDRETRMIRVQVVLDLDGGVRQDVSTGLKFFDHLLEMMARHGGINLGIKAEFDTELDDYHLLEEVGATVGRALREALRDAEPVVRFSDNFSVSDDALVLTAIDICGRGHCVFDVDFERESIGFMNTQNVSKFFRGLCASGGVTAHLRKDAGRNDHNVCEALFIGFGRALGEATRVAEPPVGSKNSRS